MKINRKFKKEGFIWIPRYSTDSDLSRLKRYKHRFSPKLGFNHIQGSSVAGSTGTSQVIVLGSVPTPGNLVCLACCPNANVSGLTVQDSNSNNYTVTPNSPSTFQGSAGETWLAYLLNAPANVSDTITVSWTGSATTPVFAGEFSTTGGTGAFDIDIGAFSNTSNATISTPTITPTGVHELLYAGAAAGGTINAVGGGWTAIEGIVRDGDWAEYILDASSATAVNFTQTSGTWSSMAMAFSFTPSGGATTAFLLNAW